ncbi:hypothetical protein [Nocardia sp. NRRL S-836]|nr:hypothetical protein [Nocardia sp. NRRL S-836]
MSSAGVLLQGWISAAEEGVATGVQTMNGFGVVDLLKPDLTSNTQEQLNF